MSSKVNTGKNREKVKFCWKFSKGPPEGPCGPIIKWNNFLWPWGREDHPSIWIFPGHESWYSTQYDSVENHVRNNCSNEKQFGKNKFKKQAQFCLCQWICCHQLPSSSSSLCVPFVVLTINILSPEGCILFVLDALICA